jgi:hypothetical protein
LARLIGQWIGDGSLIRLGKGGKECGVSFVFNKSETKSVDNIRSLMNRFFGLEATAETYTDQGWTTLRYHSSVIARFFKEHVGEYSHNKRVPDFIYRLPAQHRFQFLAGVWTADGYLTKEKNGAVTLFFDHSNEELTLGLVRIMRSLGLGPTVSGGRVQPLGTRPHYRTSLRGGTAPELCALIGVEAPDDPQPLSRRAYPLFQFRLRPPNGLNY